MAKTPKTIPMSVLTQMFSLSPEQVEAVIKAGGGIYTITKVTCLGMLGNGQFLYDLEGENLPKHISSFKMKVVAGDTWAADSLRVLDDDFVLCWA